MGFFIGLLIVGILGGAWVVYELIAMTKKNQIDYDKVAEFRKNADGKVFCPKCGNTDIGFSTSYGVNMATGHRNVCKKCGFAWTPNEKYQ